MLFERIGHADGCFCELRGIAQIMLFDLLYPAFDFTHIFQIQIEPVAIRRAEITLQTGNFASDPIENASIRASSRRSFCCGSSSAEQLIEHNAWVSNHRKRLRWRRPTDRAHVHARVTVMAA